MNRVNFKVKNFKPFNQPEPKVKKVKTNNEFTWEIMGEKPIEQPGIKPEKVEVVMCESIWEQMRDIDRHKYEPLNLNKTKKTEPKKINGYTITETKLGKEYNKGHVQWHKNVEYKCEETGAKLRISDSIAGCAVQHIYGWYNYQDYNGIEEVLEKCIKTLHSGVGFVTCQVGSDYNDSKLAQGLIKLGFEDTTYKNYQHDSQGNELGHFYTLKIEK